MADHTPEIIERVARTLHMLDLQSEFPECSQYSIEQSVSIWRGLGESECGHYTLRAIAALDASAHHELVEALESISEQYENQDLNHEDFRVGTKHLADAALAKYRGKQS